MKAPFYSIILAAGKGTRMHSSTIPKVCFEVNGTPAILRAMQAYSASGIEQFVVVVGGNLAGKVISTVSEKFTNVVYACQPEQKGTANAVSSALEGLRTIRDDDDILLVAGDRIIDKDVLEQFYDTYYSKKAELAVLALYQESPSSAGHILCDKSGTPMTIVEMADIRQRKAVADMQQAIDNGTATRQALLEIVTRDFFNETQLDETKGKAAFPSIWDSLIAGDDNVPAETISAIKQMPSSFDYATPDGEIHFTPAEAEASPLRNNSVYIVKCALLKAALGAFTRNNAQQEIYLSDLLQFAYNRNSASTAVLTIDTPEKILGFNNLSELLEVEKLLSKVPECKMQSGLMIKSADEWQDFFSTATQNGTPCNTLLRQFYGDEPDVIQRQSQEMLRVATAAATHFAHDRKLICTRAPGRLNVMGRHVDHQGGNCNLMTISFETFIFAAPRQDDTITIAHCDADIFSPARFSIGELLAEMPWDNWDDVINSPTLTQHNKDKGIDWSDYIRAAILRIQKKYKNTKLRGMDIFVGGNIPMAAGLSSSSSLIVCVSETFMAINGIKPFSNNFITLCGESEWFVGTHGGNADHAAVSIGSCGYVTKMHFFDFAVEDMMPFPPGYSMLVCDSGIKARKSSNAKDQFNHRVCCYKIGFKLIRKYCPQYAAVLHHLRDVNTETLHIPLRDIYKILLMLPETPNRRQIEAMLPDEDMNALFAGHESKPERIYPIRSIVMYGLCEMRRAANFASLLKKLDLESISEMFRKSHNGDRVVSTDSEFKQMPYKSEDSSTHHILSLLDDLDSGDLERVKRAQLEQQEGNYACSIPEIDTMVDIANSTPGVIGAQLAGAGLGGCLMIFAKNDAISHIQENLTKFYYAPTGRTPQILVCRPVAGAGTLKEMQ